VETKTGDMFLRKNGDMRHETSKNAISRNTDLDTTGKVTTEISFQTHGQIKKNSKIIQPRSHKRSPQPPCAPMSTHAGFVGSRSPPYASMRKKESSTCRIGKDVKSSQTEQGLAANAFLQKPPHRAGVGPEICRRRAEM